MRAGTRAGSVPSSGTGAAGVSLIEALISLAIMGIITTGMYSFFMATNQSYSDQAVVSRTLWAASDAMKYVAQDLRRAGSSASTSACAQIAPFTSVNPMTPAIVNADNAVGGSITIRVLLDDPGKRIELASNQVQTNATLSVLATAGYQTDAIAFLTDGTECTRFKVTALVAGTPPGLTHVPANDGNTANGAGHTYTATAGMVYREMVNERITYSLDASDPRTSWLSRTVCDCRQLPAACSCSSPQRLVPDIQSLAFSYLKSDGTTVTDPASITTLSDANAIRNVNISVTARADTRSRQGNIAYRSRTLSTSVKLRNTPTP